MAGIDLFLKLDGIVGESTDRDHRGEIDVAAFSWAEHLALAGGTGGGAGTGKAEFGDLQVIARTSVASPVLMLACASGRHLRTARLAGRRNGEGQRDHLVLTLTDVVVTTYRVGADESGDHTLPTDQLSLTFKSLEYTYVPQRPDGSAGTPVTVSWDRARNGPVAKATTKKAATPRNAAAKKAAAKRRPA